ncbi:MAG: phytanoyl-CoA dioxygenase family protein, partial [Gammaproteobacteria bacterium]|nr:phytanoyl-CoA dioxygenase family protein [Gammaproteobacteria bacterium]
MPDAVIEPRNAPRGGSSLTDEEKFLFDLRGFVVVPHVLSHDECEDLIRLADEIWPRQPEDGPMRRFRGISSWGQRFVDLMDDDRLLPYLVELVGSRLRIDHDYCIFMRKGAGSNNLHGGPWRYESDHWYRYHDGVMRNGLTVATWNLTDVGPGDGGFACVPGSHKSNFLQHMPRDVARFERREDWVVQPTLAAGDVLIFTEALIHGTTAWTADHERRTLLYKYSPPHSTWTKRLYGPADFPEAKDRQRRLMAPPSVEAHPRVV